MKNLLFSTDSNWIWLEGMPQENCYLQFQQAFYTEAGIPAVLHVSVQGQYVVAVDEEFLPSTQYPDYPHRKSVQVIPLPMLAEGRHTLDIQVHHSGADTSVSRRELPGVRFELWQGGRLLAASTENTPARPMTCYRSGPIANITGQLGVGFAWSHQTQAQWQKAKTVDRDWSLVKRPIPELQVGPLCCGKLFSQGIFMAHESDLQQYAALSFRERWAMTDKPEEQIPSQDGICFKSEQADGIYLVLDLGRETVGYLDLDMVCPKVSRVDIGFGEHLDDLRVRTDVGGRHFTVQWEAGPERSRFVHRFLRLGGRYLQLFIYSPEVTVYHIGLQKVDYPVNAEASFKSSDRLMDKIFEVSKDTLRCSMHEHYEDCPWREQALYAADSRNQMLSGYYAFGEFTQPRESLRTLALSLREDGLLELCAPARVEVDIPSFSLVFIVALEEYCRYSGDVEFGREMLPVAGRILQTFHAHLKDGLMYNFLGYWNFYEWRPLLQSAMEASEQTADCPLQLFYLLALQRMGKLCEYLALDAPGLSEQIETVTQGLEEFWDPEECAYASFISNGEKVQYAQLVQALALYTGACPEQRRDALCRGLLADQWVPVSLAYSIFKYEALLMHSREYAEEVFRQIADRWGNMLYQGATTFWETDVGAEDFGRAGSLCHGWSGTPAYLFGAYILGVRPEAPGMWTVREEEPCMYYAEGTLHTPQGPLHVIKKRKSVD